jgi:hypothetical protein
MYAAEAELGTAVKRIKLSEGALIRTSDGGYFYATRNGLYQAVVAAVRPGFEVVFVPPLNKYVVLYRDGAVRWVDGRELAKLLAEARGRP